VNFISRSAYSLPLPLCPFGELEETIRMPSHYVDEAIQQDLKSNNLSVKEAIVMAQNRPLWRLMSTFGAMPC